MFKIGHAHGGLGKVKVDTDEAFQVNLDKKSFRIHHNPIA